MPEYLVSITYCGVDAFGLYVLFILMCDRSTLMQYILVHICGVSGYVVRIYWICIVCCVVALAVSSSQHKYLIQVSTCLFGSVLILPSGSVLHSGLARLCLIRSTIANGIWICMVVYLHISGLII